MSQPRCNENGCLKFVACQDSDCVGCYRSYCPEHREEYHRQCLQKINERIDNLKRKIAAVSDKTYY